MIVGIMAAGAIYIAARYRSLVLEVRALRYDLATITPGASQAAQDERSELDQGAALSIDPAILPGAGAALAHPPGDFRAIMQAMKTKGPSRYRFPLGWYASINGPALQTAELIGDVNHVLISGQSDAGKDNAVMGMMLTLATQYGPQALQLCVVDGKGLDWAGWERKAHTWRLALDPEEIAPTMLAISDERRRRGAILRAAGVAKWDEYTGSDMPLLVVFISELSLLEDATKATELTAWLNSELSAGRAFGLRFIIGTQNASNFSTRWRGQIGLYLAGFQPSRAADEPNTGLSTSELESLGAVPPSQLPAPPAGAGVFTAVQGRNVVTVRTSLLPSKHRAWVLAQLPNKVLQHAPAPTVQTADDSTLLALLHSGAPLPLASESVEASYRAAEIDKSAFVGQSAAHSTSHDLRSADKLSTSYVELPLPAEVVPFDEQRKIIEAAPTVKSKRQLAIKLYNTDGGQKSTWVSKTCDAIGLLQSGGAV